MLYCEVLALLSDPKCLKYVHNVFYFPRALIQYTESNNHPLPDDTGKL